MIIATSISPCHVNKESQQVAVNSWSRLDCQVISFNKPSEIDSLLESYPSASFQPTHKTIDHYVGKPLVSINEMIDYAKWAENDLLLINSDIILSSLPPLRNDGVTIFSRYDYDTKAKFEAGFDVFYIPEKFLKIFPPSIYGMGVAFWDYWLPKHCILAGIPVYYHNSKLAFHKEHNTQYSHVEWNYIGEYFKWEFKYDKQLSIPQVATKALAEIKSKLILC